MKTRKNKKKRKKGNLGKKKGKEGLNLIMDQRSQKRQQ